MQDGNYPRSSLTDLVFSSFCGKLIIRENLYTFSLIKQRPAEMRWEKPTCVGDVPSKRSGHSFTEIESFAYLFGGCVTGGEDTPPTPSNELYKLDMGTDSEQVWNVTK